MLTQLSKDVFLNLDDIYLVLKDIYGSNEINIFINQHPKTPIIIMGDEITNALDIICKYMDKKQGYIANDESSTTKNDERSSQNFLEKFEAGTESKL